jgi:hypothetical protein
MQQRSQLPLFPPVQNPSFALTLCAFASLREIFCPLIYTRRRSLLTTASEQHSSTRSRIKNGARIHPAHPQPGRRGDE